MATATRRRIRYHCIVCSGECEKRSIRCVSVAVLVCGRFGCTPPVAGFMTHVTCRLTAKNRNQLQNPTLGNRVWATFALFSALYPAIQALLPATTSCLYSCHARRNNNSVELLRYRRRRHTYLLAD